MIGKRAEKEGGTFGRDKVGRREKNKTVNALRETGFIEVNPGNRTTICSIGLDHT